MEPIHTFNGLFGEARERKLRVVHLREDEHGYFHACWRNATTVYREIDRRQPFTAAHDAFMAAIGVVPTAETPKSEPNLVSPTLFQKDADSSDLFG